MGFGIFLDEFSGRISDRREREYKDQRADDQNELEILQILAREGSPGIREAAGASLIDMVQQGPGRRPRAKGLRGFLGEAQKSPHLEAVRNAMYSPGQATTTHPASLPGSSPVQPGAPPMNPAMVQGASQPMVRQTLDGVPQMVPQRDAMPPDPMQQPTPPPEPKIRSLFPTAEEIAENNARAGVRGRFAEIQQAGQMLGQDQQTVWDTFQASQGYPPSRKTLTLEAVIGTVDGQPDVVGILDRTTGQILVEGIPVQMQGARKLSGSVPRPPTTRQVIGADGQVQVYAPPTLEPGQTATIPGVTARTPPPAPDFSGQSTVEDAEGNRVITQNPRNVGGPSRVVGRAPEPRGAVKKTQEQSQLEIWAGQVAAEVKKSRRIPAIQQLDQITQRVTGGRIPTYNELQLGARGHVTPRGSRTGIARDQIQGVADDLARRMGLPPAAPPPPK